MFLPKTTTASTQADFALTALKNMADTLSTLGTIFDSPTEATGSITLIWTAGDIPGSVMISSSYDDGYTFSQAENKAFNKAMKAGDKQKMGEIIRRNQFSKTLAKA